MSNEHVRISERIVKFVGQVIRLANAISGSSAGKKIADQFVGFGTSIGANYEEAHGAQSRADFAHKLQIALKESRETRYWLCVVLEAGLAPEFGVEALIDEATQISAILGKSVATVRGTSKTSVRVLARSSMPQDRQKT